jgi:ribosomal protein S18 acetylase RimI-like enzyme
MTAVVTIRAAVSTDRPNLRRAVFELQDYERQIHQTRLPGELVADAYVDWLLTRASTLLVAERNRIFVGFVGGWIEEQTNLGETPESNRFGYVSDICVMRQFRGCRIGARLLGAIEQQLCLQGVTRIRINSLAGNTSAQKCYARAGFVPYEIMHEKFVSSGQRPGDHRQLTRRA